MIRDKCSLVIIMYQKVGVLRQLMTSQFTLYHLHLKRMMPLACVVNKKL